MSPGSHIVSDLQRLWGGRALGFLRTFGESSVHFIFLDAGRRIAGLIKILFFGAVPHAVPEVVS